MGPKINRIDVEFMEKLEGNIESAFNIIDNYFGVNFIEKNETPLQQEIAAKEREICLQETLNALNATTIAEYLSNK